jgi:hypothetical protein
MLGGCFSSWQAVYWDVAVAPLDPHLIGIAAKPEQDVMIDDIASVDSAVFEQVMKKKGKSKGAKRQKGGFAAAAAAPAGETFGVSNPVLPLVGIPLL